MNMPELDKAALSGPMGRIVTDLDPHTEAAPVAVLASLLAMFSAYCPDARVKSARGEMPVSFWPVLVGTTGAGKGLATSLALKVVRKALPGWVKSDGIVRGLPVTALGLIEDLESRCDDGDTTPDGFVQIESEGHNFVDGIKRQSRLQTLFCQVWDGEDIRYKTAKTNVRISAPHFATIMHVQPRIWGAVVGSKAAAGGLYNRMVPILVGLSKELDLFADADASDDAIRKSARRFKELANGARDVETITVSKTAAKRFATHHRPACRKLLEGASVDLVEMAERSESHLIRLAGLYALADGRSRIESKDFDAGLALVRYSVESISAVLPTATEAPLVTKIRDAVREHGELSSSELFRIVGRATKREVIDDALKALPNIVREQVKTPGKTGRPSIIYRWTETTPENGAQEKGTATEVKPPKDDGPEVERIAPSKAAQDTEDKPKPRKRRKVAA